VLSGDFWLPSPRCLSQGRPDIDHSQSFEEDITSQYYWNGSTAVTRFQDSCYTVWRRILRLDRGDDTKKVTVRLQERQSLEAAQIKFFKTVGESIKESPQKHRYKG